MDRRTIGSGYPSEASYGYARAVRAGPFVFVSGTTARGPALDGDAAVQLRNALEIAAAALTGAGAALRHVVRTVVYVTDMADAALVEAVHGACFGAIRPASTLVQVTGLSPAAARVEIEVTAVVTD